MKVALAPRATGYRNARGECLGIGGIVESAAHLDAAVAEAARMRNAQEAALPFVDRVALYVARAVQVAPVTIAAGLGANLASVHAALCELVAADRVVPIVGVEGPLYRVPRAAVGAP